MIENAQGFAARQDIEIGGMTWEILEVGTDWAFCIAMESIGEYSFDDEKANNFSESSLYGILKREFFPQLLKAGAPESLFREFGIDLTANDGWKNYGTLQTRIGLITCDVYRRLRGYMPWFGECWWTATPDTVTTPSVCVVADNGTLDYSRSDARAAVHPVCFFDTKVLQKYLNGEHTHQDEQRDTVIAALKAMIGALHIAPNELFEEK